LKWYRQGRLAAVSNFYFLMKESQRLAVIPFLAD